MARNSDGTFASKQHLDRFDHQRQLQMELDRILRATGSLTNEEVRWAFQVCQERPAWAIATIDRINAELAVERLGGGR